MSQLNLLILFSIFGLLFVNGDENYLSRRDIMEGQVFPEKINVILGETMYFRLAHPIRNQSRCTYRQPGGTDIDIPTTAPATSKISSWSPYQCGVRITNASIADSGHWRLTSFHDNDLTRGVTIVLVQASNSTEMGQTNNVLTPYERISPEGVRYCYVLRPDQDNNEFPIHQECRIPQIDKDLEANGIWTVVAGVDGKTDELQYEVNVEAKIEQLVTSVRQETGPSQIHLSCNILNTDKIITFCRFLRLDDNVGFNIEQGQGNSKYSYYGEGFHRSECGMTVYEPATIDRSTWKCYIGFMESGQRKTMGAILDASEVPKQLDEITADDVYGLNGTDVNILCKTKLAIDYCWLIHPSGRRISVSDAAIHLDSDEFRYFGTGLKLGECGITVRRADINDTGTWQCHVGTLIRTGFEVSREVKVRISESYLVASDLLKQVPASSAVVLECTTIPVGLPVDYCRFVMPDGRGFSINENITSDNALEDNYYFNPNRDTHSGYCSIIVRQVTTVHRGMWTCAGRLIGREFESGDDFVIEVIENGLSVASVIGMVLGTVLVGGLITYVGVRSYKKRRLMRFSNTTDSHEM